ncbi:putative phage Mu protein gp47-like protein [Burkholderia sp. Ch1-1]|nr:putative phage Mu protein gp47-like protein [Burkholderia sp. Ch1-1]
MADPNSSVPPINWLPSGPVVPDESDIFDGVMADANAAFGGGMNTTNLSTPQGQLAQSTTAIIGAKNDDMLEVVNGMDPDKADGRFQDGIGRIYFIDRNPAEPTVVTATCMGAVGTQIPIGTKAKATDGNFYMCTQPGEIPVSGTIDLQFACTVTGPIPCPANSLSVSQAIPGLDRITNASAGVIGSLVESRADFENRRRQSVALNGSGAVPNVRGRVLSVANVLDAYVTDNGQPVDVVIGGVTVGKNSLYVCVAGGATQDIAQAIWTKKSPGCNYTGGTSEIVFDTDGYTAPFPQFTVQFDIATGLPILFNVQIADDGNLPANIEQLVQQAIVAAFSGSDGGQRARIGRRVLASRYYPGVEAIDSSVELLSIQIGTVTANANFVNVNINQIPTLDPNNIVVTLV